MNSKERKYNHTGEQKCPAVESDMQILEFIKYEHEETYAAGESCNQKPGHCSQIEKTESKYSRPDKPGHFFFRDP